MSSISTITGSTEKMLAARAAFARATTDKRSVEIEDIDEGSHNYMVSYIDQYGEFQAITIPKKNLINHIENSFTTVFDSDSGGEHIQWEDSRTAADYLVGNENEVIAHYLNNLK